MIQNNNYILEQNFNFFPNFQLLKKIEILLFQEKKGIKILNTPFQNYFNFKPQTPINFKNEQDCYDRY